jgi:hypothetical protein
MSGIHQQHDPVDVKSLGDAIHFAAHRCARAESVRGDWAVSAKDWTRAPRPNAWILMPRPGGLRRFGWTDLDPVPGHETGQGARWNISRHPPGDRASRLPRSWQAALQGRSEPSARSDSGQSRGGFSEQTHGRAGYVEVVGGVVIIAALGQTILTATGMPHLIARPSVGQPGWFNGLDPAERSLTRDWCGVAP